MRRPSVFLWLCLGILGLALVLLLTRGDQDHIGPLSTDQFGQAAMLVAILVFLLASSFGRGTFGRMARYAMIWSVIVGVLLVGYTYREEIGDFADRVFAELSPAPSAATTGDNGRDVVVNRSRRSDHFVVVANVNNAPIEMLIDTGATIVTLTYEDASLAGIPTRGLRYNVSVATANGTARAAAVVLDDLTIGPIRQRRVVALVAEQGALDTSLLGLNFLNALSSYTVSGNQMTLTP